MGFGQTYEKQIRLASLSEVRLNTPFQCVDGKTREKLPVKKFIIYTRSCASLVIYSRERFDWNAFDYEGGIPGC